MTPGMAGMRARSTHPAAEHVWRRATALTDLDHLFVSGGAE